VKCNAGSFIVGVIADKGVRHYSGTHNFDHETFSGVCVFHDDRQDASVWKNGQRSRNKPMSCEAHDVLLFRLDPLQCRLTVINSRTRQTIDISDMARGDFGKLVITMTLSVSASVAVDSCTRVELRQVTAAERTMLE
jgi:hypothetical protein